MPRNATTALYTRVDNSFSNPIVGTTISPSDADTFFDDVEASMNSFIATSTTSLLIEVATKTFTVQASKSFLQGMSVAIFSDANHANYMSGTVNSYSGTTLEVDVTVIGGSGTLADWSIFTAGARGPIGVTGKDAGYSYSWLTATTSSDPGAGNIKANHATFSSITEVYLSETDDDGNAISAVLAAAASGDSTNKFRFKIYDPLTPTNFMEFDATALTDNGGWDTLAVTPRSDGGSFTASLALRADISPVGDKGDTGPGGNATLSGVTTHGVVVATGTTTATSTAEMTDGQILVGQTEADPLPKTVSGDATMAASGAVTNIKLNGVAAANYVRDNATSNLAAGYTATSFSAGTKSSGTFTPDPANGNFQHYTNGGAHTLAPPSSVCTMILECTNATAGALTTSGFTIVSGDVYSSSGTKKHIFYITKTNSFSQLHVQYVTGT